MNILIISIIFHCDEDSLTCFSIHSSVPSFVGQFIKSGIAASVYNCFTALDTYCQIFLRKVLSLTLLYLYMNSIEKCRFSYFVINIVFRHYFYSQSYHVNDIALEIKYYHNPQSVFQLSRKKKEGK